MPKWSQNGAKREPKCSCGAPRRACERASVFLMPQSAQNGAKKEPKLSPNLRTCEKKTITKTEPFPDNAFWRFLLFLELFLVCFLHSFLFFFENSKKGRHAFRLRHGECIKGRTYQNRAQIAQESLQNGHRKTTRPEVVKKLSFSSIRGAILESKSVKSAPKTC